ncbi:MAG: nicotinamide riboside transporter PnuC [Bacteroidales bacterium]|nr:nicotinamide riboside transporter PnuC [Bacteroidales bacterium]MDD4602797.1 nicotinamide riboside transporter PnuC [Bacteroidales bacterium]
MDFTSLIYIGPFQTSFIELFAVAFGLLSVWFMKKESTLVFPFGIINVLIYVYIFFQKQLYANAGINGFFFMMSVYGWYNWSRKGKGEETIKISRCNKVELLFNGLAIIFFFFIIRWLLTRYTGSQMPNWDALTTAVYIIAQWMLSQKKIENWILWISADSVMIVLCAFEGLYFSSFQYFVFTIIAVLGFLEWRIKLLK